MITFPNAKINIGLFVTERRSDGYHNIETLFYPIDLCDILEVIPSTKTTFSCKGLNIPGKQEENLILKAFYLFRKETGCGNAEIHLHKIIPFGAGLGGGSSDAAHALKLFNNVFETGLSDSLLVEMASKLGADCPFFIHNKPVYAEGTGNIFTQLKFSLKGKFLVLVKPPIHVSTQEAYRKIIPCKKEIYLPDAIKLPIHKWKDFIVNDFETPVFELFPEIKEIKNRLYQTGAEFALMSGSGASVFGIFNAYTEIANLPISYFTKIIAL